MDGKERSGVIHIELPVPVLFPYFGIEEKEPVIQTDPQILYDLKFHLGRNVPKAPGILIDG